MAQTALIQVRVDAELKQESEALLKDMGLDTPTAIRIFLRQVITQKGIPFVISKEKPTDGPGKKRFPSMDHPVHLGTDWKWNRDELYDRNR
jgi:addiction module RelB/DinJ family antitoxin